jgi:hemerythrin-like domain-containing protein
MLDVTRVMVDEHKLILRMVSVLEENTRLTEEGSFQDWGFFLDAVDFIRSYADRFHHAKEEDILFRELVRNGMPKENSPVAAMLMAHDQGRAFVRGMEEAAIRAMKGDGSAIPVIVENAKAYVAFIRDHIDKEDHILYPLAERVLPADWREEMNSDYAKAEAEAPKGLQERYVSLVEGCEAKVHAATAEAA